MTFSPTKMQALLKERGLTATGLAKMCGWLRNTGPGAGQGTDVVAHWLKGRHTPDPARLFVAAHYLQVEVAALCEDEK